MSFIGKRVINHRRIGLAIGLVSALTTVGVATGGVASAAPAPPPIPKDKAVHRPAMPKTKVKSKTQKAPAGSKGKSLAGGYQTVVSADVAIGPGQARPNDAQCPAGTQVLGGGAYNTSAGGVILTDSYPSGTGWYTWAYNRSGSAANFRAYALCGTGVDRYEIIRNGPHNITNGAWESRSFCSAGDLKKIGGGVSVSSYTGTITLTRNFPDTHLNNWQVWVNKSTPEKETFSSHIICGNLPGFQYSAGPSVQIPEGGYVKATSHPCPAGTTVIGGAGASSAGILTDSFPEGNAWTVYAKSNYPGNDTVTPLAVCAS